MPPKPPPTMSTSRRWMAPEGVGEVVICLSPVVCPASIRAGFRVIMPTDRQVIKFVADVFCRFADVFFGQAFLSKLAPLGGQGEAARGFPGVSSGRRIVVNSLTGRQVFLLARLTTETDMSAATPGHPPHPFDAASVAGRLAGRRILVTGAASGIGRSIAEVFAAAGARVACLDRQAGRPIHGAGDRVLSLQADITDAESVADAVAQTVKAFGGLDGLVNSAGIANTDPANEVSLQDWRRVIDVNLTGTFIVCQACEPHLRQAAGSTIVNFSSGQGLLPSARRSAYAASKAGVIGFTRAIALEWGPAIRVNSICPGATDTPMVREGYGDAAVAGIGARYALGRIAEPQEMALAALYLTSAESSFVHGVALAVDGGRAFH
jgi:NAD(P)-dependent dehydrogenase (short-subunit alcohol dehydrogenase family)